MCMNIEEWEKVDIIYYGKTITVGLHLLKVINISFQKVTCGNIPNRWLWNFPREIG